MSRKQRKTPANQTLITSFFTFNNTPNDTITNNNHHNDTIINNNFQNNTNFIQNNILDEVASVPDLIFSDESTLSSELSDDDDIILIKEVKLDFENNDDDDFIINNNNNNNSPKNNNNNNSKKNKNIFQNSKNIKRKTKCGIKRKGKILILN